MKHGNIFIMKFKMKIFFLWFRDEDAAIRWPWIQYIKDNGDLLYVQSHREKFLSQYVEQNQDQYLNVVNKEKGIQGKIKSVIKRSRSFTKKDVIDKNIGNKHHNHHKKKQHKTAQTIEHVQNKYIHETQVSDCVNLTCKNISVPLQKKIEDNFISLENVLGIISGLDLDPMLDDFNSNVAVNEYVGGNCNAIIVQGILPSGPAGKCGILIGKYSLFISFYDPFLHAAEHGNFLLHIYICTFVLLIFFLLIRHPWSRNKCRVNKCFFKSKSIYNIFQKYYIYTVI